jgi:hypothetical protein
VDTSPDGQGSGSPSRQRPGRLNAESPRIETCLGGVSALQGRDPTAVLVTVASESTQLRQITAGHLSGNDHDA